MKVPSFDLADLALIEVEAAKYPYATGQLIVSLIQEVRLYHERVKQLETRVRAGDCS